MARMDIQGDMAKINLAVAKLDPSGPEARALKNPANAPAAPTTGAPAPGAVDPRDAAALRANASNPAAAAAIDKKYGDGTASQILHDQGIAMLRSKMVQ